MQASCCLSALVCHADYSIAGSRRTSQKHHALNRPALRSATRFSLLSAFAVPTSKGSERVAKEHHFLLLTHFVCLLSYTALLVSVCALTFSLLSSPFSLVPKPSEHLGCDCMSNQLYGNRNTCSAPLCLFKKRRGESVR